MARREVLVTDKPTAQCNWCGRRIQFSPMTGDLAEHHTRPKRKGRSPICGGSNKHRDLKPQPAPTEES